MVAFMAVLTVVSYMWLLIDPVAARLPEPVHVASDRQRLLPTAFGNGLEWPQAGTSTSIPYYYGSTIS